MTLDEIRALAAETRTACCCGGWHCQNLWGNKVADVMVKLCDVAAATKATMERGDLRFFAQVTIEATLLALADT